jgi:anaerobic selenocysteine-containing dehydrogenase
MDLSRRDFFNLSAGALTGTALGGIAGLGVSPAPTLARAQEARITHAKATPNVCPTAPL